MIGIELAQHDAGTVTARRHLAGTFACVDHPGAPFAALNFHLREEFNFGGGVNVMAGWRWRGADNGRLFRIGLQYYASGLRRFVERIGPDATKRLFLTAETVSAAELLNICEPADEMPVQPFKKRKMNLLSRWRPGTEYGASGCRQR